MSSASQKLQSIEINLLQMRQEVNESSGTLLRNVFISAVAIVIAGMGWMYVSTKSEIKQVNTSIEQVNAQIKEGQAKLSSSPTAGSAADFVALPLAISHSKPNALEVLNKLTTLMPLASNLTALSFGDNNRLKVTGNFASTEDVVSFMQAAKSSSQFTLLSTSGMTKIPAVPEDKNPSVVTDPPLPVIQATFDLQFKVVATKKG